jgi:glycosyltransferase involved in cell wall biosynthesis
MPILSIVVPVYNVEQFIEKCLDSIRGQTFTDFEVICIDDGSTDISGKICDKFHLIDRRFKVIHQENAGVSSARNRGIDEASGEWIAFVDPDDYISSDYYEAMIESAKRNNADIVYCHSISLVKNKQMFTLGRADDLDGIEAFDVICLDDMLMHGSIGIVWQMVARKAVFDNVRFDETIGLMEDIEIFSRLWKNVKKICYAKNGIYFYRLREGSLSRKEYFTSTRTEQIKHSLKSVRQQLTNDDTIEYLDNMCRIKLYQEFFDGVKNAKSARKKGKSRLKQLLDNFED